MPDTDQPDAERALWLELHRGPAVAINRVALNVVPAGGLRISFAEQYDENAPSIYRAAVIMSDWNAFELWKLLGQMHPVMALIKMDEENRQAHDTENGA